MTATTAASCQARNADNNYYLVLYSKKHLLTSGRYELKSQSRPKSTKYHIHAYVRTCAKLKGRAPSSNVAFLSLKHGGGQPVCRWSDLSIWSPASPLGASTLQLLLPLSLSFLTYKRGTFKPPGKVKSHIRCIWLRGRHKSWRWWDSGERGMGRWV